MTRFDTVTFLSDLGTADEQVGVVKSVLRDLAPHVVVVDLTHDIAPFDVRAGSIALARAVAYLPSGVVIAAVDPAAGTRPPIAVEVAGGAGVLIGPDNGLLAPAVALAGGADRAVVLDRDEFHLAAPGVTQPARDIYAPVAAALCNGTDLFDLGTPVAADVLVPGVVPLPREEAGAIVGEILAVDRFGNCQLNIGPDEVEPWGPRLQVTLGDTTRIGQRVRTFADVGPGAVGLVIDGSGTLAVVLDRRSAADEFVVTAGDQATLRPLDERDDPGLTTPVSIRPLG